MFRCCGMGVFVLCVLVFVAVGVMWQSRDV